ncbi:MAG: hypothetical protein AAF658_02475 [Myxococcota bacterium]
MMTRRFGIFAILVFTTSCLNDLDQAQSTTVGCADNSQCPSGLVCASSGVCVPTDVDLTVLTAEINAISPSVVRANDVITASFRLTRTPLEPPVVTVSIGATATRDVLSVSPITSTEGLTTSGTPVALAENQADGTYVYRLSVSASGPESVLSFRATATDEIQQSVDVEIGSVVVDLTAPSLELVSAGEIQTSPESAFDEVSALGPGSSQGIILLFDDAPASVTAVASDPTLVDVELVQLFPD